MASMGDPAAVGDDGNWCQVLRPPEAPGKAALFLDRDGVLVEEVNYLHRARDVRLIPGAAEGVARANARGVPVVLVTNQAGIAYGYYEWAAFARVQAARKPNPGMLLAAGDRMALDMARSWIVGDRVRDLEAGLRAGLQGGLHVLSGHGAAPGEREAAVALAGPVFQVLTADSLADAPAMLPILAP
jgi:D-glycero-D-manno-heptose 1,7-bisphosphate phosphatase